MCRGRVAQTLTRSGAHAQVSLHKKTPKRGQKTAVISTSSKLKKAAAAKPPLSARERNLKYYQKTAQRDARTKQLMRKVSYWPWVFYYPRLSWRRCMGELRPPAAVAARSSSLIAV